MPAASSFNLRALKILLPLAVVFLVWSSVLRIQQINFFSGLGPQGAVVEASSPSGYAGGRHRLIVPGPNLHSYEWILDTEQMFARGEWRIRHVDYDNAPLGRVTYSPSPYRWWLGAIAACDHWLFNRPMGLSIERAALIANPLLHLLLLLITTVTAARWFGPRAAAVAVIGLTTLVPLAGVFVPGAPDSQSLTLALTLWSVLPLLQTPCDPSPLDGRRDARFFLAGIAAGFGMWINVEQQGYVLLGIALGGIAGRLRGSDQELAADVVMRRWRLWALGGAAVSLAGYLIEYFPAHLDWRLQTNHPMYGLAWLGLGELVAQVTIGFRAGNKFWKWRRVIAGVLAVSAIGALPICFWITGQFPARDFLAAQLTGLPDGTSAATFGAWLARKGLESSLLLTCLPLIAIIPIVALIASRCLTVNQKTALTIGLGPLLVVLLPAWFHLRQWSLVEITLLALLIAAAGVDWRSAVSPVFRWCILTCVWLIALGGLAQLWPPSSQQAKSTLHHLDVISLIERDVAHWLADRSGEDPGVILSPPYCSLSLVYFGGLRGLGSPTWENQAGVTASIQILSSLRGEVALDRLGQRGVTHIVLPSWDHDLDDLLQWSMSQPENSLLAAIRRSALPPWIRPLAYSPPLIPEFKNESVAVLRVTDENEAWVGLTRRAEYHLEMKQLDEAESASIALKAYPGILGALASRAEVEKARSDEAQFATIFTALRSQLRGNPTPALPWDRRVSLAIVLALGGEGNLSREQAKRCLDEINEARIRDLNTGALYRLMVLTKTYDLQFPTPQLRQEALRLLPTDLRTRF